MFDSLRPHRLHHARPQASLSITNSWSLLRLMSIESMMPSTQTHVHWVGDAIQPSHPLSSLSPPALNLSQHQGLFKWVSSSHQVAKYWSFSFSISPSNEHLGLIFFRMDWLDLFAVQGTLKSLLKHHSSKASILWCSATQTEKVMVPHSSTLAWKTPWTEEPGRLQSMESWRVGHDWVTSLSLFTFMHWRRKW